MSQSVESRIALESVQAKIDRLERLSKEELAVLGGDRVGSLMQEIRPFLKARDLDGAFHVVLTEMMAAGITRRLSQYALEDRIAALEQRLVVDDDRS